MMQIFVLDTFKVLTALQLFVTVISSLDFHCIPQDFGHGSVVCVCNSTYCDTLAPLEDLKVGTYFHLTSSKGGKRFDKTNGKLLPKPSGSHIDIEIKVDRSKKFQQIIGFGGAFTDAAGINIASLSQPLQGTILKLYYGKHGLQFNLGRVPIAGSDFSTHPYSYDDFENDTTLSKFSLAEEDLKYKIPYLTDAMNLNPKIKLFASPWSSPKWMKTNNDYKGFGSLKKEYYQVWANYFIKFLDEYSKHNLTFWGLTTQNEPLDGYIPDFPFNALGWTPENMRDWIKFNLGPTLVSSNHSDVKIMILDDQRYLLLLWTNIILRDKTAAKYVSGVGLHWYGDKVTPPEILDIAHSKFPNHFLIGTEACNGALPFEKNHVILGSWDRAVDYASSIFTDLNHYVTGWSDWNLVLNSKGGPNWANNFVDSPIIANSSSDVIYKQPMYYALGHFSKYLPENSVRIRHQKSWSLGFDVLTCLRPDGMISTIFMNRRNKIRKVRITDSVSGYLELELEPHSLHTVVYA